MPHLSARRRLLLSFGGIAMLAGCGGGNSNDNFNDRTNTADPLVRVVHAANASGSVALYRNGQVEVNASSIAYKAATQYYTIPTGAQTLAIRSAAGGGGDLASVAIDAQRGHKYTALVTQAGVNTALQVIDDPYNKGLLSDKARVRFANASVNAQNLDLYLTDPNTALAAVNPTIGAVGYRQVSPASGADSVELTGASYSMRLTSAGSKTTVYTTPVDLPRNADWLLVTIPDPGAGVLNPGNVRVLRVRSDDSANPVDELASTQQ